MAVSVDQIKILVKAETAKAMAGLKGVEGQSKRVSTGFSGMLKTGLAFGGVTTAIYAVTSAVKSAIKTQMQFEQAIANVQSVSGGTREELSALAREAGKNTVYSATQAADALYLLASSGMDVKDMAIVLTPTLNLAAAAQMGIAEATDIVVSQLKVFGKEMSEAENVTDLMMQTVRKSNTNLAQLGEALKMAGPLAKQAGWSFEDLNATIGAMANRGIKASMAGTQLRQAIARLINPPKEAQKALTKYNVSLDTVKKLLPTPVKLFELLGKKIKDPADMLKILGVRQAGVMSLIKDGNLDLVAMQKAMKSAGGAAQQMADIQLNTLTGQIRLLDSAWKELILSMDSTDFLKGPVKGLRLIVVAARNVIIKLSEFFPAMEVMAKKFEIAYVNIMLKMTNSIAKGVEKSFIVAQMGIQKLLNLLPGARGRAAAVKYERLRKDLSKIDNKYYKLRRSQVYKLNQEVNKLNLKHVAFRLRLLTKLGKREKGIFESTEDYKKNLLKEFLKAAEANDIAFVRIKLKRAKELGYIEKASYDLVLGYMANITKATENAEKKKQNTIKKTSDVSTESAKKRKKEIKKITDEQKMALEVFEKVGSGIAKSIGGGAGEAIEKVTDLISNLAKAAMTGDAATVAFALVGAAIQFVFDEIAKGQKFREMQTELLMKRMTDVELAYHDEVLRLMNARHERERMALDKRLEDEMDFFLQSSEAGRAYNALLAKEESEKTNAMTEEELRRYNIKKKFERERTQLEEAQAAEKKALEDKQKAERNKANRNRFYAQKKVDQARAWADYLSGWMDIQKTFPMPWDEGTRNSLISNLRSIYNEISGAIGSMAFVPEYARGTAAAQRGLGLVGERGPELVNFRGGEQVVPNNRVSGITTNNMGNTFKIGNLSLNGVQDVRQLAAELNKYANSMGGKTIFAGT